MIDNDNLISPSNWVEENSKIRAIGIGGGGCNAINYMFNHKIKGCTFIVCNTDKQSLDDSPVQLKIQLGEGLGAGCDPVAGRNAAIGEEDQINKVVLEGTEMLFITAGMGGGTGTGAAPVIAAMARAKKILTVAVVTLPFEANKVALARAVDGIKELEKNVDSLLLINNEKLYDQYGDLLSHEAFPKTDEILATAIGGITEIIRNKGYMNMDFNDVKRMMSNSGLALLGRGEGIGEDRIETAVDQALNSPLLNDFDIMTAKNVLINITAGKNEQGLKMIELQKIKKLISELTGDADNFKDGLIWDDSEEFKDKLKITVIATGFKMKDLSKITDMSLSNIIFIDDDFKYEKTPIKPGVEIEIPETGEAIKIGYNEINKKCFYFKEGEEPILTKANKDNIAFLERSSAIKRYNNKGDL